MTEFGHPAAVRVRRGLAVALAALLAYASVVLLLSRRDVPPLPSLPGFVTASWPTISGESPPPEPAEPVAPSASESPSGAVSTPIGAVSTPIGEPVGPPPAALNPSLA